MQSHYIRQQHINSSLYTAFVSPKDYQKKIKKANKIMLGKPIHGKQKMNLEQLKALSRQIIVPKSTDNTDIMSLCKNLKQNMYKAKSRVLHNLKNSNSPQDIQIYNIINNNSSSNTEDEDDDSSVSTTSSSLFNNDSLLLTSYYYTQNYHHLLNMNLLSQLPSPESSTVDSHEVTEDQINHWLQRGGFSYTSSPITMATDQELADLLHFDDL